MGDQKIETISTPKQRNLEKFDNMDWVLSEQ